MLETELNKAESSLCRAYQQIENLDRKLAELTIRYHQSIMEGSRMFRYKLRLRIVTLEGILNAYCEYALWKNVQVKNLRFQLYQEDPDVTIGDGNTDFYSDVDEDYEESDDDEMETVWSLSLPLLLASVRLYVSHLTNSLCANLSSSFNNC